MTKNEALFEYLIRMGDNALILGQRLGEWCGHAHQLESDIALTNVALDQMGQCRMLLTEAGRLEGNGRSEDDLAFFRNENEFKNNLLVEQDNENFAHTITRQYLFDVYQYLLLTALTKSTNEFFRGFAMKSIKEVTYHKRLSGEWILRLGNGTEESHEKMQEALEVMWPFTEELFEMTDADAMLIGEGIVPDLHEIKVKWEEEVLQTLRDATLAVPDTKGYFASGGRKKGHHTEYMGFILAEMQALPRSMPDAKW